MRGISRRSPFQAPPSIRPSMQSRCNLVIVNRVPLHMPSLECRLRNNMIDVPILSESYEERKPFDSKVYKNFALSSFNSSSSFHTTLSIEEKTCVSLFIFVRICALRSLIESLREHNIALLSKNLDIVVVYASYCNEKICFTN